LRHRRSALLCATTCAGLAVAVLAAPANASTTAIAAITGAHEIAHFDESTLQQPENLALEPDGSIDLTFNRSREVGRVSPSGTLTILATLPQDSAGDAIVSGIVRLADGALLVDYDAGSQSGIWLIPAEGGSPDELVAVPGAGWLNGLAYDQSQNALFATDSTVGVVWRISLSDDSVSVWAQDAALRPTTSNGKGANGIKVHDGSVWVGNTTTGELLRIPIARDGAAGAVSVAAQGVTGIDDFAFAPGGEVVAAQNAISQVSLIDVATGAHTTVLTAADGVSNPTSAAVRGNSVYITSGAYFTGTDPNLLEGRLVWQP
jgi:WD40 repeat protein